MVAFAVSGAPVWTDSLETTGRGRAPAREGVHNLEDVVLQRFPAAGAEILALPHVARARAAGLLEALQRPPTRSGRRSTSCSSRKRPVCLQATIFEGVYARYGLLLHHRGAFLLDGRVEQDPKRGFSFLVERMRDLYEVAGDRRPEPRAVSSSGAFVRAGKKWRGRRAI